MQASKSLWGSEGLAAYDFMGPLTPLGSDPLPVDFSVPELRADRQMEDHLSSSPVSVGGGGIPDQADVRILPPRSVVAEKKREQKSQSKNLKRETTLLHLI